MLDILVPQVGLQGPCIVPFVGQREPASVTQHVRVGLESKPSGAAGALDHAGKAGRREGGSALEGEHIS